MNDDCASNLFTTAMLHAAEHVRKHAAGMNFCLTSFLFYRGTRAQPVGTRCTLLTPVQPP